MPLAHAPGLVAVNRSPLPGSASRAGPFAGSSGASPTLLVAGVPATPRPHDPRDLAAVGDVRRDGARHACPMPSRRTSRRTPAAPARRTGTPSGPRSVEPDEGRDVVAQPFLATEAGAASTTR